MYLTLLIDALYFINLKSKVTDEVYTFLDTPTIFMHYEKKNNKLFTVHRRGVSTYYYVKDHE